MKLFQKRFHYKRAYDVSRDRFAVMAWVGNKTVFYFDDIRDVLPKEDQDKARSLLMARAEWYLRHGIPKVKEGIWSQANSAFLRQAGSGYFSF